MAQTTTPDDAESDETNIKQTVCEELRMYDDVLCAVIERAVQGEIVKKVYVAHNDKFAFCKKASPSATSAKKFKLCKDIETAQERGSEINLVAKSKVDMDIEQKVSRLTSNDGASETSRPSHGRSEDKYADVADSPSDDPRGNAAGPIGTSDEHGGGYRDY